MPILGRPARGSLPALRKWREGATPAEFKRIAPATRIYRSDEGIDPYQGVALHSVSVCDLAKAEMTCESTAVLGQPGRVFYVSPGSVYVWNVRSGIFRIPLDGSAPSMLKANGSPVDQFSFLESDDGHLNVLVRANGRGDGVGGRDGPGALAMLRVPLRLLRRRDAAPAWAYHAAGCRATRCRTAMATTCSTAGRRLAAAGGERGAHLRGGLRARRAIL
jgi:hypothetical protein